MSRFKRAYAEKLRDPRWQKKRLEVFQRDNFACNVCGSKEKELQVHHYFYDFDADPWEYELTDLVTLCKGCHEEAEDVRNWFKQHLDSNIRHLAARRVMWMMRDNRERELWRVLYAAAKKPEWWKKVCEESEHIIKNKPADPTPDGQARS